MKKILSIVLILTLVFALVACGAEQTNNQDINDISGSEISSVETTEEDETLEETSNNAQWKEFLKEYEEWIDSYIEITKKYKENPTDMSLISDYTEMMTELTEWSTKTADVQKELEEASPAELAEYSAELAKLAAKLAKVAY